MRHAIATLAIFTLTLPAAPARAQSTDETKEALQGLQELIGGWKGNGTSEKNRSDIWKESANWNWRFKGKDVFFAADMPESKMFKSGEIRYLPAKEAFQVTFLDKADKKQVYDGKLKKNKLIVERVDANTNETHQIQINTAGGGDRLIMTFSVKPPNRTLYNKVTQVAYTREGITFAAAGSKKAECVVTGGLGTMAVTYKGATYYVCCTGCRDAFNDNPDKIMKEYFARKKAGQ